MSSGPVFRVSISLHNPDPANEAKTIRSFKNISSTSGMVFRRFYEI